MKKNKRILCLFLINIIVVIINTISNSIIISSSSVTAFLKHHVSSFIEVCARVCVRLCVSQLCNLFNSRA